jgi:hypothetical protein
MPVRGGMASLAAAADGWARSEKIPRKHPLSRRLKDKHDVREDTRSRQRPPYLDVLPRAGSALLLGSRERGATGHLRSRGLKERVVIIEFPSLEKAIAAREALREVERAPKGVRAGRESLA